jgi:carbon-monoxide dehydrogenase large subunit
VPVFTNRDAFIRAAGLSGPDHAWVLVSGRDGQVLARVEGEYSAEKGQALCEQMAYDPETGQPVTGSLMDYAAPRADIVACEFVTEMDQSTPCRNNPLGVKGVGELGTIGAAPSVVNAVADAMARAGFAQQAPLLQMPLTPVKLWEALQ